MFRWLLLLAGLTCVLSLGACKRPPKTELGSGGAKPSATAPGKPKITPGALPAGWPEFLPVYPGATIIEGRETYVGEHLALAAIMEATDPIDKVNEFYGVRITAKGFDVVSSSQVEGEILSVYRNGGQSLTVSTKDDKAKPGLTRIEINLVGLPSTPEPEPPANDYGASDPRPSAGGSSGSASGDGEGEGPPAAGEGQDGADDGHPLLPPYPGATPEPLQNSEGMVMFRQTTTATKEAVLAHYRSYYKSRGFTAGNYFDLGNQLSEAYVSTEGTVYLTVGDASIGNNLEEKPATAIILKLQAARPGAS
jgi:hypothetical protein